MVIKTVFLLSYVYYVLSGQTPTPPNPQQFVITAGKSKGAPQIEVTTNYVDRLADLFRIDVTNEGRLTGQAFYYGVKEIGYDINYNDGSTECKKTKENYADMLKEWQTLSYAGRTKSISQPYLPKQTRISKNAFPRTKEDRDCGPFTLINKTPETRF